MMECQTGSLRTGHLQLIFSLKNFSPLVVALLNIYWLFRLQFIDIQLQNSTIRTVPEPSLSQDQCERIWDKLLDLSHQPTGHLLCSLGHRLGHVPLLQYVPVGSPLSNQVKAKFSLKIKKKNNKKVKSNKKQKSSCIKYIVKTGNELNTINTLYATIFKNKIA